MGIYHRAVIGFLASILLCLEIHSAAVDSDPKVIQPQDVLKVMTQEFSGYNSQDAFSRSRYFIPAGNVGRDRMQNFIQFKFSNILGLAGGRENGHVMFERPFQTSVKGQAGRVTQVTAVNYLVHLNQKESNPADDEPLVILANYDTDVVTSSNFNPVEENGSGLAALLVLGEKIAAEINSGGLILKSSIILAAVDASLLKYTPDGLAPNATTGADDVATKFLPEFLINRPKGIRGVIVLDNLMNFQGQIQTQGTNGFDRSYPSAYQEIAQGNFAGDFVALVARGDDLDRPLVQAVTTSWNATKVGFKGGNGEQGDDKTVLMEPRLIKFEHDLHGAQGEGYVHFLKSDQSSFWNHKSQVVKPYPAILLTDTRSFRFPVCKEGQDQCDNFVETTAPKNLLFVHRTILTVYDAVVKLQAGGASRLSGILTFIPLLIVAWRHFHF